MRKKIQIFGSFPLGLLTIFNRDQEGFINRNNLFQILYRGRVTVVYMKFFILVNEFQA